jgi:hypothetical protein
LWLIGLIVATETLPGLMPGHVLALSWGQPTLLLTVPIVAVAWIIVDARPALGLATCLALEVVTLLSGTVQLGYASYFAPLVAQAEAMWPLYAILLALGGLALWRLRGPRAVH